MLRRFFHTPLLCVLLLLIAQQGALSHAVWHVYKSHQSQAYATYDYDDAYPGGSEKPSRLADLCTFDLAFGQVLGGTHNACILPAFAPAVAERIHDLATPRLRAAALTPKSRGPPVLL